MITTITICIYNYPYSLKSAVYGLEELFILANQVCRQSNINTEFKPIIVDPMVNLEGRFNVILLPPSIDNQFYLTPNSDTLTWLHQQYQSGSIIASACAGAFILAALDIAKKRTITTHWKLADQFKQQFPSIDLDSDKLLIDHGDIISAGGMMSRVDLGLELVTKYSSSIIMRQLGKILVVDTARREQRFYQQFIPCFLHHDQSILKLQYFINDCYQQEITVKQLADKANMTERTVQRRFLKATGLTPHLYLQRLRIQKACYLLENSNQSFEQIAYQIGYQDTNACRKTFTKVMGLTPNEFRKRF